MDKLPPPPPIFPGIRPLFWIFAGMSLFGWLVFMIFFGYAGFMWFVLAFAVALFVMGLISH